jgi:hypothetical protein
MLGFREKMEMGKSIKKEKLNVKVSLQRHILIKTCSKSHINSTPNV